MTVPLNTVELNIFLVWSRFLIRKPNYIYISHFIELTISSFLFRRFYRSSNNKSTTTFCFHLFSTSHFACLLSCSYYMRIQNRNVLPCKFVSQTHRVCKMDLFSRFVLRLLARCSNWIVSIAFGKQLCCQTVCEYAFRVVAVFLAVLFSL